MQGFFCGVSCVFKFYLCTKNVDFIDFAKDTKVKQGKTYRVTIKQFYFLFFKIYFYYSYDIIKILPFILYYPLQSHNNIDFLKYFYLCFTYTINILPIFAKCSFDLAVKCKGFTFPLHLLFFIYNVKQKRIL